MNLLKHKLGAAALILSASMISSCTEKNLYEGKNGDTPSLATYATTQDVQFAIQYKVSQGFAAGFDVYAENPVESFENGVLSLRTDIKPIAAGIAESGNFNLKKSIPGYVKELYAYSNSSFAPRLMHATIQNGTANFTTVDLNALDTTPRSRGTKTSSLITGFDIFTPNDASAPAHDGAASIPGEVMAAIDQEFPEGKDLTISNPSYIQDAVMEVLEETELWITPVITGCSSYNTLGYFCYDGPKSDLAGKKISELNERFIVQFPYANLAKNQMRKGGPLEDDKRYRIRYYDKAKGQLVDKFPKGTTIVWFLWIGLADDSGRWGGSPNQGEYYSWEDYQFYSHHEWNAEYWKSKELLAAYLKNNQSQFKDKYKNLSTEADIKALSPHTAYYSIKHNQQNYVFFSFDDQLRSEWWPDHDFNDMTFMISANPSAAIIPPVVIDKDPEPVTQTENRFGVLAYEDNWPGEGDYDLNDVVVKYNSETTYVYESASTYVSKTEDTFTLIHSGATFRNSFSIKYDIAPSKVRSVTVNGVSVTPRADGNGYVIDVCPDVLGVIKAFEFGQSHPYKIVTTFVDNALSQADFQSKAAPYNPYISHTAGVEVHLPMYLPTTSVDTSYFGTRSDCSDPSKGIYYVGKEDSKYPFALHLSGVTDFTIPTEKQIISLTFPRYDTWVKSGFQDATDWYVK